jgi:hypothetical protein
MNFDPKIAYYKVVILDKIFPMPCCTPQSNVIWSMFLGFNCQESNCEFDSWPFFWPLVSTQKSKCCKVRIHFWYLHFKTFTIIYCKFNLLFIFLSKRFKTLWNSNFQNDLHFKMLGAHFHPTLVQVCKNPRMFFLGFQYLLGLKRLY